MTACAGVLLNIYNRAADILVLSTLCSLLLKSALLAIYRGNGHILVLSTEKLVKQASKFTGQIQSYLKCSLFLNFFFQLYLLKNGASTQHSAALFPFKTLNCYTISCYSAQFNFKFRQNLEQVVFY